MSSSDQKIQMLIMEYSSAEPVAAPDVAPESAPVAATTSDSGPQEKTKSSTSDSSNGSNVDRQQKKPQPKLSTVKKHMKFLGDVNVEIKMEEALLLAWVRRYESGEVTRGLMVSKLNYIHGALIRLSLRRDRLNGELKGMGVDLDEAGIRETPDDSDSI